MLNIPEYTQISKMFVDGNVQDSFKKIHTAIEGLKATMGPQLSRVYVQLELVTKTPLQMVNDAKMRAGIQTDLLAARKSLQLYTRTYSTVTTRLAIASSNFSLPQFLAKNGIPTNDATAFAGVLSRTVRKYWDTTYGALAETTFSTAQTLKKLIDVLQSQIELMEGIAAGKLDYLKTQQAIMKLFEQEKKIYWKEFYPSSNLLTHATNAGALLNAHLKEFVSIAAAKEESFHRSFSEDIGDDPAYGRVLLITIVYLVGFIGLLLSIKGDLYKAIPGKIISSFFNNNGISARGYNLLKSAQGVAGSKTGDGIEAIASAAQRAIS